MFRHIKIVHLIMLIICLALFTKFFIIDDTDYQSYLETGYLHDHHIYVYENFGSYDASTLPLEPIMLKSVKDYQNLNIVFDAESIDQIPDFHNNSTYNRTFFQQYMIIVYYAPNRVASIRTSPYLKNETLYLLMKHEPSPYSISTYGSIVWLVVEYNVHVKGVSLQLNY